MIYDAKRFTKERWLEEREDPQQLNDKDETAAGNIEWTMDMKVHLLLTDEEERKNVKGFMKRMEDRWNAMYPTLKSASKQKLRDNALKFEKEKEITNLILVGKRQQAEVEGETGEHQESSKQKKKTTKAMKKKVKVILHWKKNGRKWKNLYKSGQLFMEFIKGGCFDVQGWIGMYILMVPSLSTKFINNSHQNLSV